MLSRILSLQKNRLFSTFSSINEYHQVADKCMDQLVSLLDDMDSNFNDLDYDLSQGVLTVQLKSKSFVINKQPPNQQIWYSSPISGPKRFEYDEKEQKWISQRDSSILQQLLASELKQLRK